MKQRYRTGDQAWVRERNLAIVLTYLWEARGPISRPHLTRISGLNKSTIGSLLAQLQSWGFVRESGVSDRQRPGRPGMLIDINPDAGRLIGVEIGVDFISVALADMKADIVWQRRVENTEDGELLVGLGQTQVLEQTERMIQEAIQQAALCQCRLFGLGVGVPGLVDRASGTLLFAPNLGWSNVPLHDMWQSRFGIPVIVENEANAAALGERMLGAAQQVDNFVYLSAGVGLGGGLMIGGNLYAGDGGFAGEVGHMTLVPDGPPCKCGSRGCWEVLIGPNAIVDQVRRAAAEGHTPGLLALPGVDQQVEAIRIGHVLEAAAQGEPAVLEVMDTVGHYLGIGIANLVNAFNPSLVVLGGVLSLAGPYILPGAQQEISARALAAPCKELCITLSPFMLDACVMGEIALVLRKILDNPAAWQPKPAATPDVQAMHMASAL